MIAKALDSLKRNPVLIAFYVAYLVVMFAVMFTLYPNNIGMETDPMVAMGAALKMMGVSLLMGILGMVFFAGYGKMVADAVVGVQTSAAAFSEGLKKFFVRVLLAALLLIAFYIGYAIVLGIIMIPISIAFAFGNPGDPTAAAGMIGAITSIIMMIPVLFVAPFILLWYPAIFIDDIGVMEGLKRGAKAGVKCYWQLVLALLVMYIPSIIYMVINFSDLAAMRNTSIFTPGYIAMYLVMSFISVIFIPFIFVAYNEKKPVPALPGNDIPELGQH